jgi:hypothetical protein
MVHGKVGRKQLRVEVGVGGEGGGAPTVYSNFSTHLSILNVYISFCLHLCNFGVKGPCTLSSAMYMYSVILETTSIQRPSQKWLYTNLY